MHRQHEDDAQHPLAQADRHHDHRPGAGLPGEEAGPLLGLHLRVLEVADGEPAGRAPELLPQPADVRREVLRHVTERREPPAVPLRAAQHPVLGVDGVRHDPVDPEALAERGAEHVERALHVRRPAQRPFHVQGELVHHQALRLLEVELLVAVREPVEVRGEVADLGDLLVLAGPQVPLALVLAGDDPVQVGQGPGERARHPASHQPRHHHRDDRGEQHHPGVQVEVVHGGPAPGVALGLQPLPHRGVGGAEAVEQRLAEVDLGIGTRAVAVHRGPRVGPPVPGGLLLRGLRGEDLLAVGPTLLRARQQGAHRPQRGERPLLTAVVGLEQRPLAAADLEAAQAGLGVGHGLQRLPVRVVRRCDHGGDPGVLMTCTCRITAVETAIASMNAPISQTMR